MTPASSIHRFGGDALGFVSWLEANGNFVIVHRFDEDTDGDGRLDPEFGDHGEPQGDWPSVWLYPLPAGEGERWDELVATDPQGRWVVLRRGDELVAVSAQRRWPLTGADVRPDPSPCAPARQAGIEPSGQWLTFMRADPARAVVKRLSTGEEREVLAEGVLWRADPMPRGWVMLREVLADTDGDGEIRMPRRQGTCICRWCSRFASSVGGGRLVGDESRATMVDARGQRWTPPDGPIPVAPDAVWSLPRQQLFGTDGVRRPLGDGCSMKLLPLGSSRIVVSCAGKPFVWDVATDERTPIKARVEPIWVHAPPSGDWVPVAVTDEHGMKWMSRLNLSDGAVEQGPRALRWGTPHPSGWRLVASDTGLAAWDVATGTTTVLDVTAADLDGLVAHRGHTWFVIDPLKPKPVASLEVEPRFVGSNGCYVKPHRFNHPVHGPFEWVCP